MGSRSAAMTWILPILIGALFLMLLAGLIYQRGYAPAAPPPFATELHAGSEAQAPLGTELLLRLDLAGLPAMPTYIVEMTDALGVQVLQDGVGAQDAKATVKVPRVPRGPYYVRVFQPSGEMLREFRLRVMNHRFP